MMSIQKSVTAAMERAFWELDVPPHRAVLGLGTAGS